MAEWYIDRSLNLESFYNSVIYKRFVDNIDEILESDLSSNELIKVLGIVGKNPNATLTYMRDIGILDIKNKPTEFILDAINTNCKNNFIILLSLIKRDDKKNDKSNIKPFVSLFSMIDCCLDSKILRISSRSVGFSSYPNNSNTLFERNICKALIPCIVLASWIPASIISLSPEFMLILIVWKIDSPSICAISLPSLVAIFL